MKTIYFITGASGVGKTTLVESLKEKHGNKPWSFLHFDSIKIPSVEEMIKEYGSPPEWQKQKTFEWIRKLIDDYSDEKIFFEGQVNLEFIREGFARYNFENYHITLMDCSEEQMEYRLKHHRMQPELFTENMKNWLRYLRKQAKDSATPIILNNNISAQEVLTQFENIVGL